MGGFYGSIHVKTEARASVQQAAAAIARRRKTRFLLGPALNGWVSLYPAEHGQDERIARAIARAIPGDVVYVLVHDDDIFAYNYYQDGKSIDEFNSRPDYFAPVSARIKARQHGRPHLLQELLAPGKTLEELTTLLSAENVEQTTFAFDLLQRFADLLGLPNAVTSYEYLMDGETEGTERWEDFKHIPDQSEEKARKRAADAAIQEEKAQLRQAGMLLYEKRGEQKALVSLAWCPDPTSDGFLVSWQRYNVHAPDPRPLERLAPPWSAGPSATTIVAGPFVHDLCLSPSGRMLAISHASGNWKTALWDLERQEAIWETDNDAHSSPRFLFSPDEKYLIGHEYNGVAVYTTGTGRCLARHTNCAATYAAMHPSGLLVVGDPAGKLILLEPRDERAIKTLCIGQKVDQSHLYTLMAGQAQQVLTQGYWDRLQSQMEKQFTMHRSFEEVAADPNAKQRLIEQGYVFQPDGTLDVKKTAEAQVERTRRNMVELQQRMAEAMARPGNESSAVRGSEQPASLLCSPDGRWLFCGVEGGLRVYDWRELTAAEDVTPPPTYRVDIAPITDASESWPISYAVRIEALALDATADLLLFAGTDGVIRRLDLATGDQSTLLELPEKTSVWRMELSLRQQYLGCAVIPPPGEHRRQSPAPTFQVWKYVRHQEIASP